MLALGLLTAAFFFGRAFLFDLLESPKFLFAQARKAECLEVLETLAKRNNTPIAVTLTDLQAEEDHDAVSEKKRSAWFVMSNPIKSLFTKGMLRTTITVWFVWIFTATGYTIFHGFLPRFLK